MFEFYHYSNFGNVCVELKMPLPTDFAADFRYRSQSLVDNLRFLSEVSAQTLTQLPNEERVSSLWPKVFHAS